MIVYKLTSPSNKPYIGITRGSLSSRFSTHISNWKLHKKRDIRLTKLQCAFEKYDPKTWSREVICECSTIKELGDKEKFYIKFYDSVKNGYNISPGGDIGPIVDCNKEQHSERISKGRKKWFQTEEGKEWKQILSKQGNFCKDNQFGKKNKNKTWFKDKHGKLRYVLREEAIQCNMIPAACPTVKNKGSSYYYNPLTYESIRLHENDDIPAGFIKGRGLKWSRDENGKVKYIPQYLNPTQVQ